MESTFLGGSLGHNPKVKVPDRVRKYLVGDICVAVANTDIPVEVKFRTNSPFNNSISATLLRFHSSNNDCVEFGDTKVYFSIASWISKIDASSRQLNTNILTKEVRSWYVHTTTLFLRLKENNHWIIMELK